jgi:(p)ppGpp synthase/HD superfamily hydrolase
MKTHREAVTEERARQLLEKWSPVINSSPKNDIESLLNAVIVESPSYTPVAPNRVDVSAYLETLQEEENKTSFVDIARELAFKAHDGQFRNDGVTPYFNHVQNVAFTVVPHTPFSIAAAYLHDVLEDTSVTEQDLRDAGIPEEVIEAVKLLTHPHGEPYLDYIKRVQPNLIAYAVKLADIFSNLNDSPNERQKAKYEKALKFLGINLDLPQNNL